MRLAITFLSLFFLAALSPSPAHLSATPQEHSYASAKVDYVLDFPSVTWRLIDEPDEIHQHAEFVFGDRNDGYLRIRKETLAEGLTVKEFARRDQDQKERFRPGFVDGKEEPFAGRLTGTTMSFEFSAAGKPMAGRTYYLQGNSGTVYVLRFTGMRDKLLKIRNQTDLIARSLRLK
ncbi:MAG: hypothetical protein QOH71_2824 [Blastocatellia bacterium]|nr:hypothetical protein [Blastocatellia bacterium]